MQSLSPNESHPGKQNALAQVNQQLESAIEQLRVAKETLLATHRELHSLSSQVEYMHQQIELLSHEIAHLRNGYAHTLEHVPYPVVLADEGGRIGVWNAAARKMFGLEGTAAIDLSLDQIPVQPSLRQILTQKHRTVIERGSTLVLKNQLVQVKRAVHRLDVHFASLSAGVLVVFRSSTTGLKQEGKIEMIGSFAS